MRNASLWRGVLGVEKAVVEELDFDPVERVLVAHVRPRRHASRRCGLCPQRSSRYDHGEGRRRWRGLDLGTIPVWLEAEAPRGHRWVYPDGVFGGRAESGARRWPIGTVSGATGCGKQPADSRLRSNPQLLGQHAPPDIRHLSGEGQRCGGLVPGCTTRCTKPGNSEAAQPRRTSQITRAGRLLQRSRYVPKLENARGATCTPCAPRTHCREPISHAEARLQALQRPVSAVASRSQ